MFKQLKQLFSKSTFTRTITGIFGFGDFSHAYKWNVGKSLSFYEKSLYVNKAISKRAEKVGQIKFVLGDMKGNEVENGTGRQWLELLDKPNSYQTGDQFWQLAQKYYDIVGACYILKKNGGGIFERGVVDELEMLRADLVEVILNEDQNAILGFKYDRHGNTQEFEPEQIIYIYRPDPRNPLLGESLIASGVRAMETEVAVSEYQANVLKNGGKLETVFKLKEAATEEQLNQLKAQYEERYADAKKAGRPLFLGGDIENLVMGLSPSELAYLDTKVSTLNDIVVLTGVPKALLGLTSDETFSNADASIRIFLRDTIKPQLDNIVNILNWRLIPDEFNLNYIDPTPEDMEQNRKNLETAHKVYALTTNEKREMLGLDPITGGDDILMPFNLTTMDQVANPLPLEAPKAQEEQKSKKKDHLLKNKNFRAMWAKFVNAKRSVFERRMKQEVRLFFRDQKNRILDNLKGKRKIAVDEVFNDGLELNLAQQKLVPLIRQIFEEQGQDVAQTFDLPAFSMNQTVERVLNNRATLFTNSIINTAKDELQQIFAESARERESRVKLIKRIETLYVDIKDKWQAERVARTEVHAAMQEANLEAYRQGGIEIKIWVWSGNVVNLREIHQAIDGEERSLNEPFSTGEMAPSLPNCACTI